MDSWSETLQGWGTTLVDRWSQATYQTPAQLEAMRIKALGEGGYYEEGQPNFQVQRGAPGLGISTGTMLLIGAAVLAVVMLRD